MIQEVNVEERDLPYMILANSAEGSTAVFSGHSWLNCLAGFDGLRAVRRNEAVGIEQCRIIELPKVTDPRGNLSFIEGGKHIPFEIKRVYYLYDVPGGETRAGHALKKTEQFIIAASGSFDLILDEGKDARPSG